MSRKRFCDLCEQEIADTERYYDVLLEVKIAGEEDDQDSQATENADFCYSCTTSGKALVELMRWYESRDSAKKAMASEGGPA